MGNSINLDLWFVSLVTGHMANETNSHFLWINYLILHLCKTCAFLHNFKLAYIKVFKGTKKSCQCTYARGIFWLLEIYQSKYKKNPVDMERHTDEEMDRQKI